MTEAQAWLVVEYAMMLDQLVGSFDGRHVEGADVAGVARSVTVVRSSWPSRSSVRRCGCCALVAAMCRSCVGRCCSE